jgi:dTDP-4-dehydrorhamnose reductase
MANREGGNGSKKLGVLLGGSGLIGGSLTHFFKARSDQQIDILAPNSKKLSLREPNDIKFYFQRFKPDFIINCAIASLDSDPKLAFEVNYLGTFYLAKAALELGIPYIHISTSATLPSGENLTEQDQLRLIPSLSNYAKSKLMAELSLAHLHETQRLDYTIIRLAVVYGTHDHKIQGFHRLLYSIVAQAMPVMFTNDRVMHSYSNAKKLPHFVQHILNNREEFSGQTYHFVDPNPVLLSQLILTIKSYLSLSVPKEIYLPYPLAKFGKSCMRHLLRMMTRLGIEARMPAELMFLKNFYEMQTLASGKLRRSSFRDPYPEETIFTNLPDLIEYYITRWEQLNLISSFNKEFFDPQKRAEEFLYSPERLLQSFHAEQHGSFLTQCALGRESEDEQ